MNKKHKSILADVGFCSMNLFAIAPCMYMANRALNLDDIVVFAICILLASLNGMMVLHFTTQYCLDLITKNSLGKAKDQHWMIASAEQ